MLMRQSVLIGSVIVLALYVHAGGRQRAMAVSSPSASTVAIAFLDANGGAIDAGTMTWQGGSRRSLVTTRLVTMRLGAPSHERLGTATLRAFLETPDPRATIRIDGVTLTTTPRLIQAGAPIGIPFSHRIEIEVPLSAPEGPLQASIGWEATTD